MKNRIISEIRTFIRNYQRRDNVMSAFGDPIVGFADANSDEIQQLPSLIDSLHTLPQNILENASVIISYYVPFSRRLAVINSMDTGSDIASPEWARAYEECNAMFAELNQHIISVVEELGAKATIPKTASSFDRKKLVSYWSQRHVAHAAGLGTFGVNNMLITNAGCCGRFSSVVTSLPLDEIKPDGPVRNKEYCLYKKNGSCGMCADKCPSDALNIDREFNCTSYSKETCYATCIKNAERYPAGTFDVGTDDMSYIGSIGSEVCGKCVTGATCAFKKY